jgi:hypothetical protein
LDLTIQGFVRALAKNPKLHLMVATNLNPQTGAYYDVHRIYLEELKLAGVEPIPALRNLILVDTGGQNLLDDEGINQLYNVSDIGINTSDGEGYGLCQLEHLFTGAPQIVTDVGTYRSFLDDGTALFIPSIGRAYFAGGMPHGGWYPLFSPDAVAEAILTMVSHLEPRGVATHSAKFKTWSAVCDEFLEDVLMLASGPASSVSVPVTSTSPSS